MPVEEQIATAVDQGLPRAEMLEGLRASEIRYRQLFERNVAGVYCATLAGEILESNESCARIFGFSTIDELRSHRIPEFYFDPAEYENFLRRLIEHGTLTNVELRLRRKDGSPLWLLQNVILVEDERGDPRLLEATLADITELKQAEEKVRRSNRLYAVLSHLNQAVVRTQDRDQLFQEVCRVAVEHGLFRMAWFGLLEEDSGRVVPVAQAGVEEGYLSSIRVSGRDELKGRGPTGTALREGRPFICNDIERDPSMLPWREEAARRGYRSSAAFPIRVDNRTIGAFNLYAAEPGFFDEENVALLEEVAADVSFALESMERNRQRQRAEMALRASEEKYRRIVETAAEGIWIIDENYRTVFVNPAMAAMLGYAVEEMIGQPVFAFMDEATAARERENLSRAAGRAPGSVEFALRRRDGLERWVILRYAPLHDNQGRYAGLLGMFTDITERKRAEEERAQLLARAEAARVQAKADARFRELMEAAPDAILEINREGLIMLLNKAAERMFGYQREELIGQSVEILISARHRERHAGFRPGCLSYPLNRTMESAPDVHARRKDGSEVAVDIDISPVETEEGRLFTCVIRDVTERKLLEEQLRQSQKMEALGRLAGGVAHDFNNLLTIIGGYGQMALDSLQPKDPLRKDLEPILEAAYRAATLTRQLLTFSRRQISQPKVLDVNRVVSRMNKMLRRVIGEDIELDVVLQPGIGRVRVDPGQLSQVIMNLVVNARDAMPSGGKLAVTSEEVELGKERPGPPSLKPGGYVMLAIRDTGIGMDAQTKSHIFEPFFTTKQKGKGTGLGLSTVYGIVKQSGGEIRVESEPGLGASFQIYFPVAGEGPKTAEGRGAQRGSERGTETILLVEDEVEVRELAAEMLRRQGYTVLAASDGSEALQLWETQRERIQVLVTDVIMPQMGGCRLAERLRAQRPDLPVLFISGYTDEVIARHGILGTDADFLRKPFTRRELARKVRAVLDLSAGD